MRRTPACGRCRVCDPHRASARRTVCVRACLRARVRGPHRRAGAGSATPGAADDSSSPRVAGAPSSLRVRDARARPQADRLPAEPLVDEQMSAPCTRAFPHASADSAPSSRPCTAAADLCAHRPAASRGRAARPRAPKRPVADVPHRNRNRRLDRRGRDSHHSGAATPPASPTAFRERTTSSRHRDAWSSAAGMWARALRARPPGKRSGGLRR